MSDVHRTFRLVAIFMTSDTKQPQIESILRSAFELFQAVEGYLPELKYVMTDADQAQRNSFEAVVMKQLGQVQQTLYLMFFFTS